MATIRVTAIKFHKKTKLLSLQFNDGLSADLTCEYLRVFSPSAEVRGHGLPEPILVAGKQDVTLNAIEPVGHYAVKLVFDDGHDTGLYSWEVLHDLAVNFEKNWERYLERLTQQRQSRKADTQIIEL